MAEPVQQKGPGKIFARRERTFPTTSGKMSYLVAGGGVLVLAGAAPVSVAGFVSFDALSQPVNTAPITSPISTIKVDIRFIERTRLMKWETKTRKIFWKF